jgi:hypothetical protein
MHGVGGAKLAGLHHEGEKARRQAEEKERLAKPDAYRAGHCLDGNTTITPEAKIDWPDSITSTSLNSLMEAYVRPFHGRT